MEFGGIYIVAQRRPALPDIDRTIRFVRALWPSSVFEAPGMDPTPTASAAGLQVQDVEEFVIYENGAAWSNWEESGRTEENADSVVYARLEPERMVFLVGRPDSPIGRVVQALSSSLTAWRHSLPRAPLRLYVDSAIPLNGTGFHRYLKEVACI